MPHVQATHVPLVWRMIRRVAASCEHKTVYSLSIIFLFGGICAVHVVGGQTLQGFAT